MKGHNTVRNYMIEDDDYIPSFQAVLEQINLEATDEDDYFDLIERAEWRYDDLLDEIRDENEYEGFLFDESM
jgi:hypothetical protein